MASQERSEFFVGIIRFVMIIKLYNIEILLGIKEFVSVVTIYTSIVRSILVPLREMVFDKELASFERFIVNYGEDVFLSTSCLNNLAPNLLICIFPKQHIVYKVMEAWII